MTTALLPPRPTALRIAPAPPDAAWDDFVGRSEIGTFAHLSGWRDVIDSVMGHEPLYRSAVDEEGRLVGILPLARVRSPLLGTHLLSVPFMNYGGPLGSEEARAILTRFALDQARESSASSLVLRTRHAVASDIPPSAEKLTVLLDLAPTVEEMWEQRFNAKFRTKIKRPQREGMEVRFGLEHAEAFYEIFARNMRDLGTPVLPRAFFDRIAQRFPRMSLVGAVYWNERPVAAGWGFVWKNEFEMTWSSSLRELGHLKPNMLLYWSFMERLIEMGVRTFNFGRSTPGSGPHEFKKAWGGIDVPLPWVHWPPQSSNDQRSGRAMQAAVSVWKRMPLPVANAIGPSVARLLPWW